MRKERKKLIRCKKWKKRNVCEKNKKRKKILCREKKHECEKNEKKKKGLKY